MLMRERSERQAARDANLRIARNRHENVELFMECEEEDLSPSQIAAHRNALKEYQDALQKISAVKAQSQTSSSPAIVVNNAATEAGNNAPQTQVVVQPPGETLIGVPRVAFPAGQPQQPQYVIQNPVPIQSPSTGYKLLFDTRTGLILGTVPNESSSLIATTSTNSQPAMTNPTITFVQNNTVDLAVPQKTVQVVEQPNATLTLPIRPPQGITNAVVVDQSKALANTNASSDVVSPLGHQIIKIIKTSSSTPTVTVVSNANSLSVLKPVSSSSQPVFVDLSASDPAEDEVTDAALLNRKLRDRNDFPSLAVKVTPQRLAPYSVMQSKQAHLDKVLKEILSQNLTGLVRWLFEHGMFQLHQMCALHKTEEMVLVFNPKNESDSSGGYRWECSSCKYTIPAQHGSFFDNSNHDFYTMLKVIHHWSCNSELSVVLDDTKVTASVLRTVYASLRSVCANKVKELIQLGGSEKRPVELAITKILKPNVLTPIYLACIYERLSGLVALQAFEGELRLDLFLEVYVLPHSTISVEGFPQIPPQLKKLQHYNVVASPRGSTVLVLNALAYIQERVIPMFGKTLAQLRIELIQSFLEELMWREKYGTNPYNTFNNILLHLKQHYRTGLGLTAPPTEPVPIPIITALNNVNKRFDMPSGSAIQSLAKFPAKRAERKEKALVLLDDYYYGWQAGNVTVREGVGNHKSQAQAKFRCHPCKKLFDNNIKLMRHMHAHIESSKQMNLDLSDLTQCKHCFQEFETPYSMQCHVEAVHSKDSTSLMCRICDHAFKDEKILINHMYMMHTAAEMPYVCKVCNYRCSMYRLVIEHFHREHVGTTFVQCHYCLQVFNIKFSTLQNYGISSPFWMHLYKHQAKSLMRKCPACCLMFFSNFDAKQHRQQDHVSFKDNPRSLKFTIEESKSVYMNMPTKDREAPVRMRAYRGYSVFKSSPRAPKTTKFMVQTEPDLLEGLQCLECKSEMEGPQHFLGYVCCSRCNYATCCGKAYANHMIYRHADGTRKDDSSWPVYLPTTMYCVCGFAHQRGNLMAYHLVQCNKKSCYPSTKAASLATVKGPEMESEDESQMEFMITDIKTDILEDETSEQQEDENPNMLNILGLMRKPDHRPMEVPKISNEDSNLSNASQGSEAELKKENEKGSNDVEDVLVAVETKLVSEIVVEDSPQTDSQSKSADSAAMEIEGPELPSVLPSAMVGDQVRPSKNAMASARKVPKKKRRWTHRKRTRTRASSRQPASGDEMEPNDDDDLTSSRSHSDDEKMDNSADGTDSPDVLEKEPVLTSCENEGNDIVVENDEAMPPILDCYAESDVVK